ERALRRGLALCRSGGGVPGSAGLPSPLLHPSPGPRGWGPRGGQVEADGRERAGLVLSRRRPGHSLCLLAVVQPSPGGPPQRNRADAKSLPGQLRGWFWIAVDPGRGWSVREPGHSETVLSPGRLVRVVHAAGLRAVLVPKKAHFWGTPSRLHPRSGGRRVLFFASSESEAPAGGSFLHVAGPSSLDEFHPGSITGGVSEGDGKT